MAVAALGLVLAPAAMPLWVLCVGLSSGSALVLALSMIGLAARGSGHGAQLSGMAQAVGYALAATGPVLAGYLRDATGSWDPALVLLAGVAVTQALVAAVPAPPSVQLCVIGDAELHRCGAGELRRAGGRRR